MRLEGYARLIEPGGDAQSAAPPEAVPVRIDLEPDGFGIVRASAPPILAAFRDVRALVVQPGAVLLELGTGDATLRVVVDRLGDRLGLLVAEVRTRRTRQRLADRLVDLDDLPPELVEYRRGPEHGVAELLTGPWSAELAPLDEGRPMLHLRRADIGAVEADPATGTLRIGQRDGVSLELLGLGAATTRVERRFEDLRDAATRDVAAIVAGLLPDAPLETRHRLSRLLVDGRPVATASLGPDARPLIGALLAEPTFAESYRTLAGRAAAADPPGPTWVAVAPERPGEPVAKTWFLVGLPGNLIALELVSPGAHATYLFRVVARADYRGQGPGDLVDEMTGAARAISEALVDGRFLREPMALPEEQLATSRHARYRLALAAIPSLAEARRRFVARLIHDDATRWSAALDALIAWHATARDEAAVWPGRVTEEAAIRPDPEPGDPPASES